MSEIENLINDKNKEIDFLNLKIKELEDHVKDFEILARVWKKGYEDMEMNYKRKLAHAEQFIEELEEELEAACRNGN